MNNLLGKILMILHTTLLNNVSRTPLTLKLAASLKSTKTSCSQEWINFLCLQVSSEILPQSFPPKISLRLSVCVCVYQVCPNFVRRRRLLDINVHLQRDRILRWFVCFVFFHIKKQQRKVRVLKANVWVQTVLNGWFRNLQKCLTKKSTFISPPKKGW